MQGERLRQAETIFNAVVDLHADQRREILEVRCEGDEELRAFVQRLLDRHAAGVEDILRTPAYAMNDEAPRDVPERIGRYRVVRVIGEGGMGIVYEARQEHPRRTVALKVIRSGLPTRSALRRFEREAEILGNLQHPGIAHIYEASTAEMDGVSGGQLQQSYFAMEYVVGESLGRHSDLKGLDTRDRLALFAMICEAVQYAHQNGVIHRDLKPGNIIVDATGQPKILDFGVARVTDADMQTVTMATDAGQLVGTVPYMSPEQVEGDPRRLDTRSDVYSLGVILYELLSGKLPYEVCDRSIPEIARIIRDEEPTRLTSIDRTFRGEIETIVGKALDKDKERRYQSAADLAADIRRHLRGEPIEARRDSTLYVLRKSLARHRHLAAAALLLCVVLVAFGVTASILAFRESQARIDLEKALEQEQKALLRSDIERAKLLGRTGDFLNAEILLWGAFLQDPESKLAFWALWELYYQNPTLVTLCRGPRRQTLAIAPDGRFVATRGPDGIVRLWSAVPGHEPAILSTHEGSSSGLTFSPDGRCLASAGAHGAVVVTDVETRRVVARMHGEAAFGSVSYAPDGQRLLTGAEDGTIWIWDLLSGRRCGSLKGHTAPIRWLRFSDDGSLLASASRDGVLKVWRELAEPPIGTINGLGGTARLALSPDGRMLASGGRDRIVKIWNPVTCERMREIRPEDGSIKLVHFLPDGRLIVAGWWSVEIWDIITGEREPWHQLNIGSARVSTDGRWLARIVGDDRYNESDPTRRHVVQITEVTPKGGRQRLAEDARGPVAVSPDGRFIAADGEGNQIRLWDAASCELLMTLDRRQSSGVSCHFDPTGAYLAACGPDLVTLYDLTSGREVSSFDGHHRGTHCSLAFSPDGRAMATTRSDGTIQVREVPGSRVRLTISSTGVEALSVGYSPDGSTIAVAYRRGGVRLYKNSGKLIAHLDTGVCPWTFAFHPDGKQLAIGCWVHQIQIWDLVEYTCVQQLFESRSTVWGVAYRPNDPSILASFSDAGYIKLWDLSTGANLLQLEPFGYSSATGVGFTPDGKTLVASGGDGSVFAWDLEYYEQHMIGHCRFYMDVLGPELAGAIRETELKAWMDRVLQRTWPRIGSLCREPHPAEP